jgi:hypothetical protein
MKIVCINNRNNEYCLTIGKTYNAFDDDGDYYIKDDDNHKWWYSKECFKPLFEIRNDKIDKLLNDDYICNLK